MIRVKTKEVTLTLPDGLGLALLGTGLISVGILLDSVHCCTVTVRISEVTFRVIATVKVSISNRLL